MVATPPDRGEASAAQQTHPAWADRRAGAGGERLEGARGSSRSQPAAERVKLTKTSSRPKAPRIRSNASPPPPPATLCKFRTGSRLAPGPAAGPGPDSRPGCGKQVGQIRALKRRAGAPRHGQRSSKGNGGGREARSRVPATGPCFPGSRQEQWTERRALLPAVRSSGPRRRHRPRPGASLPGGSLPPRLSSRSPPPRS